MQSCLGRDLPTADELLAALQSPRRNASRFPRRRRVAGQIRQLVGRLLILPRHDTNCIGIRVSTGTDVLETVGEGKGDLLDGTRSGFLHVVSANAEWVEHRHLACAVGNNVADNPKRRSGWIDERIPTDEFLENVVLEGSSQSIQLGSLHRMSARSFKPARWLPAHTLPSPAGRPRSLSSTRTSGQAGFRQIAIACLPPYPPPHPPFQHLH